MCALGNTQCGSKQHQTAGTGERKYVPGGLKPCGILQSALMALYRIARPFRVSSPAYGQASTPGRPVGAGCSQHHALPGQGCMAVLGVATVDTTSGA